MNKIERWIFKVFKDSNFSKNYEYLSKNHQTEVINRENQINNLEIESFINKEGFDKVKYLSKYKYYEVDNYETNEIFSGLRIGLNIILLHSEVDFIISMVYNDIDIPLGPYGVIYQNLNDGKRVFRPLYSNKEELFSIIYEGLKIYKEILIKIQNSKGFDENT